MPPGDVAVIIPARNEADRVAATVSAASGLAGVDIVVVVDDGSRDGTAAAAAAAGAHVVSHGRNRGKAAAVETGAEAVRLIEAGAAGPAGPAVTGPVVTGPVVTSPVVTSPVVTSPVVTSTAPRHLLLLDADLGQTAAAAGELAGPVRAGTADMTIAIFSKNERRGGFGIVTGIAGAGIERATGWRPAQPLNGQRCLTRAAFTAALPLAAGWGLETGMTIDLMRKGMRITEVEVPLSHRATGNDWRSQLHRLRQLTGVTRALVARAAGPASWRRRLHARPDRCDHEL
jgi:hypothetical protein